jgi:predicted O-methyltransferase YrrM
MIYRSNLKAPDLTPHFKHLVSRPMGHSFGHDVPSDWGDKADDDPVFGIYKRCGFWTHDEAAILYNVARQLAPGRALDIGAHTGWTTQHLAQAGLQTIGIDPMYGVQEFHRRARDNAVMSCALTHRTSQEYFAAILDNQMKFRVIVIDGDHSEGKPLEDAISAEKHLAQTGVIIFHDGVGRPVQEAVQYLMAHGFKCRAYFTPHLVFCCWRGDFVPPDHVPDPKVNNALLDGRFKNFDFGSCV